MSVQTRADKIWNRVIAAFAAGVVLTLAVTGYVVLVGVGDRQYSQATPDDVIKSAAEMVRNGDAHLLPNLLYADSPEMRSTLNRLGTLTGHVQKLAGSIKDRFPEDIERYRKEADEAIAQGKPPALLGALTAQMTGRTGPPSADQEAMMRDLIARIFADPYAWIEQNESRLTTVSVTDDLASILLDGKPVAGVGLTLKLEAEKWYLALPTNIPPISRAMPKAPEQWRMVNSLVKILDNTVLELDDDVQRGNLRSLKAIGDKAQEKIIFPGALWFGAYAADMDARGRIDRNLRQYRDRQKAWAKTRAEQPVDGVSGVSDKLLAALNRIAPLEIAPEVRARKARRWADFPDKAFEYAVAEWMTKHGLTVNLEGPLAGEAIDAAVARWEEAKGRELAAKGK